MTRLPTLALILALQAPLLHAQEAVEQMVHACLTTNTHPMHDSDLCQAFLYGIHYERNRSIASATENDGQELIRQPPERQRFFITEQEFQTFERSESLPDVQQFLQDQGLDLDLQPPDADGTGSAITIAPHPRALSGGPLHIPGLDLQVVR